VIADRLIGNRRHQPFGTARCQPAAKHYSEMMDNVFQSRRAARSNGCTPLAEALSDDPAPAIRSAAENPILESLD